MFHPSEVQLGVSTSILRVCTDAVMLITPFSAALRVGTGPVHRLTWDAVSLLSDKTALHVRPGPAGEADFYKKAVVEMIFLDPLI